MEKKMKELNPDEMNKVSGGGGECDTVEPIFGGVCICKCGAEARDAGLCELGSRIVIYRCTNGHEFGVYVG